MFLCITDVSHMSPLSPLISLLMENYGLAANPHTVVNDTYEPTVKL